MLILSPTNWSDYELIDSGNFKKLERFGEFILDRPEPQAVWDPALSPQKWENMAHAIFKRDGKSEEKGEWSLKKAMKEQWYIKYQSDGLNISFRLGLSSFKHVGIFPEQASNWDYIYKQASKLPKGAKVLNLFAYTGGASLAAKAAGADVVHVDSVKQVINWSNDNMVASDLDGIRWVVEDAMKFVEREVRRGNQYQGIILDPPSYGRGPNGEKWHIEQHLNAMIKACHKLLDPQKHFFILNLYSIGFSALIQESLVKSAFGHVANPEMGELFLPDHGDRKLPLGTFYRFSNL
jgi:23S rRNA (cytosine1962-C5)-methyltransferase